MKRKFLTVLSLLLVCAFVFGACANRPETPAEPEATATPEVTSTPEATAEPAQSGDAAAQDTMYEGALARLSEEEIAKLALAEEESGERQSDIGAEDSVD